MMPGKSEQILQYIASHPAARFDTALVTELQIDKSEINEILFSLIHEEMITEKNGRLQVTDKGTAYLDNLIP
jgi:predicted transcriptional regulator